jgi:hypothetical protein
MKTRIFSALEEANRNAYISSHIENDCGCESDGELWRPVEDCPVHGIDSDPWWAALNDRLDARWPGTWVRRSDLHV